MSGFVKHRKVSPWSAFPAICALSGSELEWGVGVTSDHFSFGLGRFVRFFVATATGFRVCGISPSPVSWSRRREVAHYWPHLNTRPSGLGNVGFRLDILRPSSPFQFRMHRVSVPGCGLPGVVTQGRLGGRGGEIGLLSEYSYPGDDRSGDPPQGECHGALRFERR